MTDLFAEKSQILNGIIQVPTLFTLTSMLCGGYKRSDFSTLNLGRLANKTV